MSEVPSGDPPRVGIAFSGGAVRGYAHLGVWEVLSAHGITPCCTAGTSAGSIIAALVAAQVPVETIYERARNLSWGRLTRLMTPKHLGLLSLEPLEALLEEVMGGPKTFADLPIPLACIAFDIEREELVVLREGPVAKAVRASCSVPGIFTPVEWEGRLLVDGGVVKNLPLSVLREMGATYTIGVNLLAKRNTPHRPRSPLEVGLIAFYNMVRANQEENLADLLITPPIREISFNNFRAREELITRGRQAAQEALPRLLADLKRGRDASGTT